MQRSNPAPIDTMVEAGPLRLSLTSPAVGDSVVPGVVAASPANAAPRDGMTYATVTATVENAGSAAVVVDFDDFGFTGADGVVNQAIGLVPPASPLAGTIAPGERISGTIAGTLTQGESQPMVLFNARTMPGNWAQVAFALSPGAAVAAATEPLATANGVGQDAGIPATAGETIVTDDWVISLERSAFADEVYALFAPDDYRTRALGDAAPSLIPYWVALLVSVSNNRTGENMAHFPATAFQLAWADGSVVEDVRILSAPTPDASVTLFPGATHAGWVAFETPDDYAGSLVRFQAYSTDTDVRYLTWGNGSAPPPAESDGPTPVPAEGDFERGTVVILVEDGVNLREGPGASFPVVEVLDVGALMVVEAGPESADGFDWYQVTVESSGLSGFIASNFIRVDG